MNDERLFERLAAHAGPADVDPGFEDRLYTLLQREMRRPERSSRPALLLVAALLTILVISAAVAIGSGVIELPWLDGSPTPSASVNPSASATPEASPSSAEPEPSVSEDAFLLQVNVDGLRMRTAASTSADVVRILDRGEVVQATMSDPVEADGNAWWEVTDLQSQIGWVATGGGDEPWLVVVPHEPAASELLLRLERDCDVSLRSSGARAVPADVTVTSDGRVVLGLNSLVRQLSPSGLAQFQQDVLNLPVFQESAVYVLERLPDSPEPPGHGLCSNAFWLGEGASQVEVAAAGWLGEEEGVYWVPSPERRTLDELATNLLDIESWLGPAAWSEPVARPYVGGSYLFWLEPPVDPQPPDYDAPSAEGRSWPFDGPVEQFGEAVGEARCGYLTAGQAFETLRRMREWGVPMQAIGEGAAHLLALDGFGTGSFKTDAGLFYPWFTARSPDGYPSCDG